MYAYEIMTKKVITISKEKTVYEAAKLMTKHDIGALPVIEDGKLIGIVTESDIFKNVVSKNILPKNILVKSIMSKNVITASPNSKISEINKLLSQHNIRRVPIIESGKIMGIISASDLIRQAYRFDK